LPNQRLAKINVYITLPIWTARVRSTQASVPLLSWLAPSVLSALEGPSRARARRDRAQSREGEDGRAFAALHESAGGTKRTWRSRSV